MVKPAEKEFAELASRSTDSFTKLFAPLLRSVAFGDVSGVRRAREKIAEVIGDTMTLADMFGRRRALLEFDAVVNSAQFAATPVVPKTTFTEAYQDLLSRESRLASSAEEVASLYREKHAFALARSAEVRLTEAVQSFVSRALKEGRTTPNASQIIQGLTGFTRNYADTVYRTNLTTAYTAGRFQQAQERGVRTALPALERWSITDSSVRQGRKEDGGENHLAAHGLVADTRDRIWHTHAPPSGYMCRCGVRLVPRPELERRGLMRGDEVLRYEPPGFSGFRAHPNFGQRRPDLMVYGGGTLV